MIDHITLQQRLTTLAAFPDMTTDMITILHEHLLTLHDWDLFRINPLAFAEKIGLDEQAAVDLFVHSARVGLFDFAWSLVCPSCGSTEHRYESINDLNTSPLFHCTICEVDRPVRLDDLVEVAFTINPSVKKLALDPFADEQVYERYFFSQNIKESEGLQQYKRAVTSSFLAIQPDETHHITFRVEPGHAYRLKSLDLHAITTFEVENQTAETVQTIGLDILDSGFVPQHIPLRLGEVHLHVRNLRRQQTGLLLNTINLDIFPQHELPAEFHPFVTGKMLLNNQSFRSLFRVQDLSTKLRLDIRSLTVLFTDLKGSTDLYDRTGDTFAYDLIQEHFEVLGKAVRQQSGAIIKTMGDAIMATFSTPQEGIRAALDMMEVMQPLNERLRANGYNLGLKVGIHEGPTLAVNAEERLDYFGQTVNVAARVQGLAQANEIWITEPIFRVCEAYSLLDGYNYQVEQHSVSLKGVREATTVYRLYR